MPQLKKTWIPKAGYTRSTGEVDPHRQRYGTRVERIRTKDTEFSDATFKQHRFNIRKVFTLKFKGPISKETKKDIEEHGFIYNSKKDEYYFPASKYTSDDYSFEKTKELLNKIEDRENTIIYEDKTITKPLYNAIQELGKENKEYAFYIDFEKLDNAQERALFIRHRKHGVTHTQSEDWEIQGHTHPYSGKLDVNAMPSPQDIRSFVFRNTEIDYKSGEAQYKPLKQKKTLLLGSDGKIREVKIVDPKKTEKFVEKEYSNISFGRENETEIMRKHISRLEKKNTKHKKLSPDYINDYSGYVERKAGIRVEELPQDKYGNYILRDVVAK